MDRPVIVWLRDDLRLCDHAALEAAAKQGPVLPVFVLDENPQAQRPNGAATRWWLHGSLLALANDVESRGGRLVLRRGTTVGELARLARAVDARGLYLSRAYDAGARALEQRVQQQLGARLDVRRFGGSLLIEPERFATKTGSPFRVFTPFWKTLVDRVAGRGEANRPYATDWWTGPYESDALASFSLEPRAPDWAAGLRAAWQPGERAARERLARFVASSLGDYPSARDRPGLPATSRLSAHLRFGEIAPSRIWTEVLSAVARAEVSEKAAWAYLRELGWREFCWHLLFHFPSLATANFRPQFDGFPWRTDPAALRAWRRGATGYPIVDAGMRELWSTGWMHNRVRMIAASLLTKHLLVDWREGEAWFWDTLVDADPANNAASWQWVAGSGADAAPYFRIFNPVAQGRKFDPDGHYVRRWVPEIARLPARYVHAPWESAPAVCAAAGIALGKTYPRPIVDHAAARKRALAAYSTITGP